MKRTLSGIGIVLLFSFMLISPKAVFTGASNGLLLWFQTILPTLFPFLLISNLLLVSGSIHYLTSAFAKPCRALLSVSDSGCFAVVTGFLCGYPMGAKITADLVTRGYINRREGAYLLSFCNNTSPVFIMNYIVFQILQDDTLLLPTLFILIASPLLVSLATRHIYKKDTEICSKQKNGSSSSDALLLHTQTSGLTFRQLDICIMDSFETLVKVGGYMIVFSVFISLVSSFPLQVPGSTLFLSCLEMTNGIALLNTSPLALLVKYPLILGLTSFGGLCSVMQTQSMIQKAKLSILPYITEKLAAALTASSLGYLYIILR